MNATENAEKPDVPKTHQAKAPSPSDDTDWTLIDPKSLKVKADFHRLIPLQAKGELMALEESIQEEGVRDPLLVWKDHNIVLDGHTRRELAIKYKKPVKVYEIDLPDEKAAIEFILKIQRERRNLTREAMSYFRGTEYNAIKQKHGGSRPGRKPKGQNVLSTTSEQLAEKYGVVDKTIRRDGLFAQAIDKIVEEYGDPDLRRKLLGADIRLTQRLARLLLKRSATERKAAVDQLLAEGELPRSKKGRKSTAPKPKEVAQSLVARLQKTGEGHPKAVVQQMARLLGLEVVEKSPEK